MKLIGYAKNKSIGIYDDNSLSHRHKTTKEEAIMLLGARQTYCPVKDGKCLQCGKRIKL